MASATGTKAAAETDIPRIVAILAAAFHDEPVMTYLFPDIRVRRARLPHFFKVICDSDYGAGALYLTSNEAAATIWRAPGRERLTWREKIKQAWPWIAASREALGRALAYSAASDANHPKEPHWYLHLAACDPALQGKGFGGAAIRAGLARSTRDNLPAYLETASEKNIPIYSALGFRVTHEWRIKNGPRCWSMLRPVGEDPSQ